MTSTTQNIHSAQHDGQYRHHRRPWAPNTARRIRWPMGSGARALSSLAWHNAGGSQTCPPHRRSTQTLQSIRQREQPAAQVCAAASGGKLKAAGRKPIAPSGNLVNRSGYGPLQRKCQIATSESLRSARRPVARRIAECWGCQNDKIRRHQSRSKCSRRLAEGSISSRPVFGWARTVMRSGRPHRRTNPRSIGATGRDVNARDGSGKSSPSPPTVPMPSNIDPSTSTAPQRSVVKVASDEHQNNRRFWAQRRPELELVTARCRQRANARNQESSVV